MPPLTLFVAVLIVHVLAAMLLAGGAIPAWLIRRRVLTARTGDELATWLGVGAQAARFNPLLAFTVLGSALYMGAQGFWQATWFHVAAGLWVVDSATAVVLVQRSAMGIGAALARSGGTLSDEVDRTRSRMQWDIGLLVLRANAVATLYLMLAKPVFLSDALWAVVWSQMTSVILWGLGRAMRIMSEGVAAAPALTRR